MEVSMQIFYKEELIGTRRVDILVEELISVEIKAVPAIENRHLAQAINYVEIYDLTIGLLINFGAQSLEFRRVINKKYRNG